MNQSLVMQIAGNLICISHELHCYQKSLEWSCTTYIRIIYSPAHADFNVSFSKLINSHPAIPVPIECRLRTSHIRFRRTINTHKKQKSKAHRFTCEPTVDSISMHKRSHHYTDAASSCVCVCSRMHVCVRIRSGVSRAADSRLCQNTHPPRAHCK